MSFAHEIVHRVHVPRAVLFAKGSVRQVPDLGPLADVLGLSLRCEGFGKLFACSPEAEIELGPEPQELALPDGARVRGTWAQDGELTLDYCRPVPPPVAGALPLRIEYVLHYSVQGAPTTEIGVGLPPREEDGEGQVVAVCCEGGALTTDWPGEEVDKRRVLHAATVAAAWLRNKMPVVGMEVLC
jgi:hypothetical protein